jgi:hypothetical protein
MASSQDSRILSSVWNRDIRDLHIIDTDRMIESDLNVRESPATPSITRASWLLQRPLRALRSKALRTSATTNLLNCALSSPSATVSSISSLASCCAVPHLPQSRALVRPQGHLLSSLGLKLLAPLPAPSTASRSASTSSLPPPSASPSSRTGTATATARLTLLDTSFMLPASCMSGKLARCSTSNADTLHPRFQKWRVGKVPRIQDLQI